MWSSFPWVLATRCLAANITTRCNKLNGKPSIFRCFLCRNSSTSSLCRFRMSLVKVISLMLNNLTTRAMALAGVLFAVGHPQCPQQRYKLSWKRKDNLFLIPNLCKDLCVPSRISALLLAFHAHTWVFGAAYYWLTWALLGRPSLKAALITVSCHQFHNYTDTSQDPWLLVWCTTSGCGVALVFLPSSPRISSILTTRRNEHRQTHLTEKGL